MIVKVQIPLAGNAEPMALVYNKDRSFETFMELTPDLMNVMGDRPKAYFRAKVQAGTLHLDKEVSSPGW